MISFKDPENIVYDYAFVKNASVQSKNTFSYVADNVYINQQGEGVFIFEPQVDVMMNSNLFESLIRQIDQYNCKYIFVLFNKFCKTPVFSKFYELTKHKYEYHFIEQSEGHRINAWYLYDNYGDDHPYTFLNATIYYESTFVFFAEEEPEDEKALTIDYFNDSDVELFEKMVAAVKYHDEIYQFRFSQVIVPKLIDCINFSYLKHQLDNHYARIFTPMYFSIPDGFSDVRQLMANSMQHWLDTYQYIVTYAIDKLPVQVGEGNRYGCCDIVPDFGYLLAGAYLTFDDGYVYMNRFLPDQWTARFKVTFEQAKEIILRRKPHMTHTMEIISVLDSRGEILYFNQFHNSSDVNFYGFVPIVNTNVSSMFEKNVPFAVD